MKENKEFLQGLVCGAVGFAIGLILSGATPMGQLKKDQQNAIKHGVAYWEITTNGEPVFTWINVTNKYENGK